MKTELLSKYVPCLPHCEKCQKQITPIKSRMQDGSNAITTCFSNLRPWTGSQQVQNNSTIIVVYAGDVIDGISVDGQMFGERGGSSTNITLSENESITSIEFGYHMHWLGIMNKKNFMFPHKDLLFMFH